MAGRQSQAARMMVRNPTVLAMRAREGVRELRFGREYKVRRCAGLDAELIDRAESGGQLPAIQLYDVLVFELAEVVLFFAGEILEGPDGRVTLADLFEGRPQLSGLGVAADHHDVRPRRGTSAHHARSGGGPAGRDQLGRCHPVFAPGTACRRLLSPDYELRPRAQRA